MRLKILLTYLFKFILSLSLFAFLLLFCFYSYIQSPNKLIQFLEKEDYYTLLNTSILEEMENYIIQSGFPESVLDGIYTEEMIEQDINHLIEANYYNNPFDIDTTLIENNLEKNIESYLSQNNIQVADQSSLDKFVKQIASVYTSEITLYKSLPKVVQIVGKIILYLKYLFIGFGVVIIILILVLKIALKERNFSSVLFTTSFLLWLVIIFLQNNIDIRNIILFDNHFSKIIQNIIFDGISKVIIFGIILFGLGFFFIRRKKA